MSVQVSFQDIEQWSDEIESTYLSKDLRRTKSFKQTMGKVPFLVREYEDDKGNICELKVSTGRESVGGRVMARMKPHFSQTDRRIYPKKFIGQGEKAITIVKTGDVEKKYKEHLANALIECYKKSKVLSDPDAELASLPKEVVNPKVKVVDSQFLRSQRSGNYEYSLYKYTLELEEPFDVRCYHVEPDFQTQKIFGQSHLRRGEVLKLNGKCTDVRISKKGNIYYGKTIGELGKKYANLSPFTTFSIKKRKKYE